MPAMTLKLATIGDAVSIATVLTHSWFRGHAKAVDALTPRVFRPEFDDEIIRAFRPNAELDFIERFQRDSPTMASVTLPEKSDLLGWLAVMQHYRTPTRLLDWTESALAAVYFAVREEPKEDAELWAMLPWALNKASDIGWGFPIIGNNPVLDFLIREPYWAGSPEGLAKQVGLAAPQLRPVAIMPRRTFARMVAQRSVFTIHPRTGAGQTIIDALPDPTHLVRYLIPATQKAQLMSDLDRLGVNHQSVMPDLEGLSQQIIYEHRIVAYGAPDPPGASGVVRPRQQE
jgi:hypothetical protein